MKKEESEKDKKEEGEEEEKEEREVFIDFINPDNEPSEDFNFFSFCDSFVESSPCDPCSYGFQTTTCEEGEKEKEDADEKEKSENCFGFTIHDFEHFEIPNQFFDYEYFDESTSYDPCFYDF